jgi:pimeloyl-[acyl-carrier protein] synthase
VEKVLHDPRFIAPQVPPSLDPMFQVVARFMARIVDPQRHRRIRSHFAGLFTPRRVETYRARISERVDALIDALPARGPVDLVSTFTRPLPFGVIADVLGVPAAQQGWLADRIDTFGRAVAGQRERANVESGNTAIADLLGYFDDLLRERAAAPREDLLSLLAAEPSSVALGK